MFLFNEKMRETENIREFAEQHEMIKGTWVLEDVPGTSEGFHMLHAFDYGLTYTGGTFDEKKKGKGDYEIVEVREDGSMSITIKSDWYGFTSDMNIEPTENPDELKIYHQTYKKISDVYREEL